MYDIIKLNALLLTELKEIAKQMGIKDYRSLKKQDLIYKILEQQTTLEPDQLPDLDQFKGRKSPGRKKKASDEESSKEEESAPAVEAEPAKEEKKEAPAAEEKKESAPAKEAPADSQEEERKEMTRGGRGCRAYGTAWPPSPPSPPER